jgi:hypothetical protein
MVTLRVRVAALETKVSPAGSLLIDGLRMGRAEALDHFRREAIAAYEAGAPLSFAQANPLEAGRLMRERPAWRSGK